MAETTSELDDLRSPDQLHGLMRVTDMKGWLGLVACAALIVASIAWGVVGRVQTRVVASGILLPAGGLVEIGASGDGELTSIDVAVGDFVHKDQVVARIAQPALKQQIETARRRLDELEAANPDGGAPSGTGRRERMRADLDRLEKQFADNAAVESSVEGRVVELRANNGEHVHMGKPLIVVERGVEGAPPGSDLEALLYFDSNIGKALRPGMMIEVSPSVVSRSRYGVVLGRVKSVEQYPSTRLGMMGALRNEQLVDSFIQAANGAPIAVRAELVHDAKAVSGYRWSDGAGPDIRLTSGTRCTGAVITRTHRPIALVFPALDYH